MQEIKNKLNIPLSFQLAENCSLRFSKISKLESKNSFDIKRTLNLSGAYAANSMLLIVNIFSSTLQYLVLTAFSNASALGSVMTGGNIRSLEKFSITSKIAADTSIAGVNLHLKYMQKANKFQGDSSQTPKTVTKYIQFAKTASKTCEKSIQFFDLHNKKFKKDRAEFSNQLLNQWVLSFSEELNSTSFNDTYKATLSAKLFSVMTKEHLRTSKDKKQFQKKDVDEVKKLLVKSEEITLEDHEIPDYFKHSKKIFQSYLDKFNDVSLSKLKETVELLKNAEGPFEINVCID